MENKRSHPFQVLVKPVGPECNLRCRYCFYQRAKELFPQEGRLLMSEEVLERLVSDMMRQRFSQTVFSWQGGEPTLAGVDFFRRVVALQQKHGAPGQTVGNSFQTNGVLLDDAWAALFAERRFLVGLSMDGPQEVHDRMRQTASGTGTWDKTMAAARLLERHGVQYNILCVIHAGNVGLGADLLRWFADEGFQYVQFIPCYEEGNPHNLSPGEYGDFLCATFDCWARDYLGKVSVRDFDSAITRWCGGPPGMCTFGKKCDDYVVVEHNGDIFPCDFFVYDDWKLGNLMEQPIERFLVSDRYRAFARQKHSVGECVGCPYRKVCWGGCQKDRRVGAGSSDKASPFCSSYQMFYAHAAPRFAALAKRMMKLSSGYGGQREGDFM